MRPLANLRLVAAVTMAALVAACAGLAGQPREAPHVTLADLHVLEIGLIEQKLGLDLRVQNPNDVAIGVEGLSFALEVNGRPLARGVSNQAVSIPRYGEGLLRVSAVSGLAGVLRQFGELQRGRDAIAYRIRGKLALAGGGSVPFDQQGEVSLTAFLGELR